MSNSYGLPNWHLILFTVFLTVGCSQPIPFTPTRPPTSEVVTVAASSEPTRTATATRFAPTPFATAAPFTSLPAITATPTEWTTMGVGLEQRYVPITDRVGENVYVYALRIDPQKVIFKVHYASDQPRSIEEWQAATGAMVVFNGGFFSGSYTPVGRIVSEGVLYGFPLNYWDRIGVAGVFAVLDGEVELYSLGRSSYSPRGMRFDEAMESYPMLLLPGQQTTYPTETTEAARRTVIGIDHEGRVIVLVCDWPIFTLYELTEWLATSDLTLESALNLDGGRSSGLIVSTSSGLMTIPAYVTLPIVMGVYPRED